MTAQVVLVGAPGSGKSTVGPLLAARLDVPFTDVDSEIEQRVGRTVAEIFADDGEAVFRAFEEASTIELLDTPGVLALGGGAVLSAATRSALRGHHVVWLQVGAGEAASRVGLNTARPLLLGNVRGRLIALLAQRRPLYAEVASHEIATDDLPPAVVVELIMEHLRAEPAALRAAQGRSGASEPGALRAAQGRSGTSEPGDLRAAQNRSGASEPGALRAAQDRSAPSEPGALRPAQGRSAPSEPGALRAAQSRSADTRPEPVEGPPEQ